MVEHLTRLKCDTEGCDSAIEVEGFAGTRSEYGYGGWINDIPCIDFDWPIGWSGSDYAVTCPLHTEKEAQDES